MSEQLIRRVKNSLNAQFYSMNDSWLSDCIEYYLEDHKNPTHEEIITFVINQWLLCDLREINNEKGCLPRDLSNKKCTTLSGKYILQMDKLYDISQSKYKQLEKIRNVSSENVEATENENKQDDKMQNWEPKSKRMLQLFLTDGIQDILAIEYKPIRFLKDSLFPGFKLLIKGPVICRRGVILLEETNISEVGGEVDSLLIVNAVENVFARALNLEENPDPYNDDNKQTQSTQSTQRTTQMEDEFDINTEIIDQIDKQVQQKNSTGTKSSVTSATRNQQRQTHESSNNSNNRQAQIYGVSNHQNQNYGTKSQSNNQSTSASHASKTQKQNYNYNAQSTRNTFDDDDDLFLNMVDEKAFENLAPSKPTPSIQHKSVTSNQSTSSRVIQNQNVDDFPLEDEIYDLDEEQSPYFSATKVQSGLSKITSVSKPTSGSSVRSNQETSRNEKSKQSNVTSKYEWKDTHSGISKQSNTVSNYNSKEKVASVSSYKSSINKQSTPPKQKIESTPSVSHVSEFPDDDFDMNDFDLKTDDLTEYFKKDNQSEIKSAKPSQTPNKSNSVDTIVKSKVDEVKEFAAEFDTEMDVDDIPFSHQQQTGSSRFQETSETPINKYKKNVDGISSPEFSGVKRLASKTSPVADGPQKMRCLQSTPKDKSCNRKITDFLNKPSRSQSQESKSSTPKSQENKSTTSKSEENSTITLLSEDTVRICEFIRDVLKESLKGEKIHTVVRGKVVNIVKLNLLKNEKGNYFYLEGTITDNTGNLDVVFSSEVLEEIIGYSTQVFVQKRKQSKSNPAIKDELREDLKKAQETLKLLDVLMEIKYKVNERAIIVKIMKLSKDERKYLDLRSYVSEAQ
ncbi:calponin homology domain-containing protein DDB_G0272472 [Nasonia vitripennis]|uniref:RecQ-mediated genome instability protein 1 n=1 Tax=Nasonia vitripennis TaxID=7425 RepID=A0A7M7GI59_NASVI|nr:calponin homology domain-containing protein DDB_G0272472 [Nasonia vitripennis]